ncbi:hypothetical protein GCM10010470_32800 [Saccharopolyspora taberi]|uniref:Band 7 domain-containing protein n=2 Tax=Saccharopolyspora taberi TaxID=60895 RepID=A0ABN3VDQ9_9PSEU
MMKGIRTVYEVNMGRHVIRIEADLPSRGDAFDFRADIDVHWRVSDPSRVVLDGVPDVRAALSPAILSALRKITRRFDVEQVELAEEAANQELARRAVGTDFGLWTEGFVRLAMDQASREHAGIRRRLTRENVAETLTQEVRTRQEEHRREVLEARVAHYRSIMAAGDLSQFALRLAERPDEVEAVVTALINERDNHRHDTFNFITQLLQSDALDRWEVDDQIRTTLQWLKDNAIRKVISGTEDTRQLSPTGSTDQTGTQDPAPSMTSGTASRV